MDELNFLAEFIVNSDQIEGIDNDLEKVKQELSRIISKRNLSYKGHVGAIMYLRKYAEMGFSLCDWMVRLTQLLIVKEQPQKGERELPHDQIGQWRKHEAMLVSRNSQGEILRCRPIGAKPEEIPEKMKILLGQANNWLSNKNVGRTTEDVIRFIARFHWQYERIHPFADGNGRSGRAIVYFLFRRLGVKPFIFTSIDKREKYYPCFVEDNSVLIEKYFLDRFLATG